MTSKYHYIRNSKQALDEVKIQSMGRRTTGYDFANDGWRQVVDYNMLKAWVESQVGNKWDDVWSAACKKYDHRNYVGKESREYISYLIELGRYSDYYVDDGILKRHTHSVYKWPKPKPKIIRHCEKNHFRYHDAWYEVEIAIPNRRKNGQYYCVDVFHGVVNGFEYSTRNYLYKLYGAFIYCTKKQQVSKRVCQKLNLIVSMEK